MKNTICLATLLVVSSLAAFGCSSPAEQRLAVTNSPITPLVHDSVKPQGASEAQQDSGAFEGSDLSAYLAHGLEHSFQLAGAQAEWMASTERAAQAGALPEPRLSYGEFLEEIQTRTGPQERRFGLSQAFPWPGQLDAKARVAEHQARALSFRVEAVHRQVVADIEVAYHDYAFLGSQLSITHELVQLLRDLDPIVQSRVRSGGGQADLLRLQVEIGRLEDDLASLERRRPALSSRLQQAANLPPALEALPLPEMLAPVPESFDRLLLRQLAVQSSPELQRLLAQVEARREAQELATLRSKPSFSVGIDYIQTGAALNPATPGSGDDPIMIGFSMSLPVWRSSYAAAEREARHLLRSARQRLDATELEILASVENLAYRADDAGRRIGLYRDSLIPRAKEALELTLSAYRTGGATILDLMDSERAFLEFELSYWRACLEYSQGEARLRALTGQEALAGQGEQR